MSSEKLSPRQQMINMMYLVLTAMLALNVSSAVLDKYGVLNADLENNTEQNLRYCDTKIQQMHKAVSDAGFKDADVQKLKIAEDSLNRTKEICDNLAQMKETMVKMSGGWDKKNKRKPKDGKNDRIVVQYMIKDENAEKLKNLVNGHIDYLNSLSDVHFEYLAVDGENDPYFSDDPNQSGKTFEYLQFDNHTPLVGAMATISGYQSNLVSSCSEIINKLHESVGADQLKFDIVRPLLTSDSNMVVAGMNYQADLFLAASSSAIVPKMYVNGHEIKVTPDGIGKISLPNPKNVVFDQNGISIQKIKTTIRQLNPATGDEIVTDKEFQYKIVKPSLDIQAGAVSALYKNCGNELVVKCSALGPNYSPNFKISGGEGIRNPKNKEMVTIVPATDLPLKDAKVLLSVFNDQSFLGSVEYPVRKVPMPQVSVLVNNKMADEKKGVSPDVLKNLTVMITPDESFASFLPKDANYKVAKWSISGVKGASALFTKNIENQNSFTFGGNEKMMLYQCERLLIEVKDVVRINCQGKEEKVFEAGAMVIKNIPVSINVS